MRLLPILIVFGCESNAPNPSIAKAETQDARGEIVFLTAPWCQWCNVMKHEVLSQKEVVTAMTNRFEFRTVDVDRDPEWMDRPDVSGLPSFLFFDHDGDHVLTKSGYFGREEWLVMLRAIDQKLEAGAYTPYPEIPISKLPSDEPTLDASKLLRQFESQLFVAVNSNRGGFASPSAHPRPKLLWELQQWSETAHAPARVETWIALTIDGAMRGSSPNLRGEPLPDFELDYAALRRLSKENLKSERHVIERLPTQDPYLGLRDLDGGFFRYAAGPGWYHPHFERLADENIAWVLLLNARGEIEEAARTKRWFDETFVDEHGTRNAQASDPFYYRLPQSERDGLPRPYVAKNHSLSAHAWRARIDPKQCERFDANTLLPWPTVRFDEDSIDATVDTVGEILVTLARCPGTDRIGTALADVAVRRWSIGLPKNARLHRLAAGLCAVSHPRCSAALAETGSIKLDTEFAPPLVALQTVQTIEETE